MKLCDITQFWSPSSGGVRRYVSEKVRWLRAAGGRHVLIVPGERDEVSGDDSARVYSIRSPRISKATGYRVLLRLGEIDRVLAAERPDVVECADPYQVGWRTARACARFGIPAAAFYHSHFAESELRPLGGEWLAGLAPPYCRRLYNRFARTLVPSPLLAETLAEWGVTNTVTVDLGVDAELFQPATRPKAELRAALGLPAGARVLLYVGRLAAEKGTRRLCEVFARLRESDTARPGGANGATQPGRAVPPPWHLVVTGEGLQAAHVKQLRADTGAVTWLPFLSAHEDLVRLYHAADLFVHPGVKETFGLVTLEAQACGLPVVGIRGTAMDRVVCHTQSFWAPVDTPKALADAIVLAFERNLPALGAEARAAVLGRFTWREVLARLFDVYREVIQDCPRQ